MSNLLAPGKTEMITSILDQWKEQLGDLPSDYYCFDLETTGFSFNFGKEAKDDEDSNDDLIVEIGHCSVEGTYAKYYESKVLNWFESEHIEDAWLEWKLERCYQNMRKAGRDCHMSAERMRDEGESPVEVLDYYHGLLSEARASGKLFVGHNLAVFDSRVLADATEEWLGKRFEIGRDEVLDTGAIEKAATCGMDPWPEEGMMDYFQRVLDRPAPGVPWHLEHCINKYGLAKKYDLDMSSAHTAGFDAMLCHLLMEEYRGISEEPI